MFHWGDGWYFDRRDDGSVIIQRRSQSLEEPSREFRLSAGEWAEAIGSAQVPLYLTQFLINHYRAAGAAHA